jgi:hypothetical protein
MIFELVHSPDAVACFMQPLHTIDAWEVFNNFAVYSLIDKLIFLIKVLNFSDY